MIKKINLFNTMNKTIVDLPTPTNITYMWNFGSMLGITYMSQVMSGLMLSMHYTSWSTESFTAIIDIMQETWTGWNMRLIHMNGASMFFIFIYFHMFRGIKMISSTNKKTWSTGLFMLLLLMMISFLGYVLPWGQMSFWAVAVITNLFSIIPICGQMLVEWIWGGFSVGNPTLMRFYSLHFITPMILLTMIILHLLFLHEKGSSNPMGLESNLDKMNFHPYFTIKDLMFMMMCLFMFMMMNYMKPYIFLDPTNNIPANPMITPIHIMPEWYFLTSYAILRAMPSKTSGVIALFMSVLIYFINMTYKVKFSTKFNKLYMIKFWTLLFTFLMLMKLGSLPAEKMYTDLALKYSITYFLLIMIMNI